MSSKITCNPSIVSHTSHIFQRLSFLVKIKSSTWAYCEVVMASWKSSKVFASTITRSGQERTDSAGLLSFGKWKCNIKDAQCKCTAQKEILIFDIIGKKLCILTFCRCWSGVSSAASVRASTISKEEDVEHCNVALGEKKTRLYQFFWNIFYVLKRNKSFILVVWISPSQSGPQRATPPYKMLCFSN